MEDSLNDVCLSTFDATDDLHRIATFGTSRWIDFVDSLDQSRPKNNSPLRFLRLVKVAIRPVSRCDSLLLINEYRGKPSFPSAGIQKEPFATVEKILH